MSASLDRFRRGADVPCIPLRFGDGTVVIACTRGRRSRSRCACGRPAPLLCDAPVGTRKKTCDRPLCHACAVEVGRDEHRCPEHNAALPLPIPLPAPEVP